MTSLVFESAQWGEGWVEALLGPSIMQTRLAVTHWPRQHLEVGPPWPRPSVQAERCRVLLYQVIRRSEKLLKGFSTPVSGSPRRGEWDAQQDPPLFHGVECPEKKPACTMASVMAEAVRVWCGFFPWRHKASPCVTLPVVVMGGGWWWASTGGDGSWAGGGAGEAQGRAGQRGACRHSQTK